MGGRDEEVGERQPQLYLRNVTDPNVKIPKPSLCAVLSEVLLSTRRLFSLRELRNIGGLLGEE